MALLKNNFQVKYQSDGDGDGHWEMVNEKGDGLKTTDDSDDIAHQFQMIADILNRMEDEVRVQTSLELTLHCNEQMAKMECEHWKERGRGLVDFLHKLLENRRMLTVSQEEELRDTLAEYNNPEIKNP